MKVYGNGYIWSLGRQADTGRHLSSLDGSVGADGLP